MEAYETEEPALKKVKVVNGDCKVKTCSKENRLTNIKVGSRKSQLALFQTNFVVDLLRQEHKDIQYEIISMSTIGDKTLDVALSKIGEKSLFTKELEVALEKKEVHMVVHSLKDLPTTLPEGMVIGAICRREDPSDVVVFSSENKFKNLKELPSESVVGTSSLRRIAQLKRAYPELRFESVRGNINTRLRKLDEDKKYSALILAAAGLSRLDLEHRIGMRLSSEECMHAVGQGALAIECRETDKQTIEILSQIADEYTTLRCISERAFMKALEGGCSVPIGVNSKIEENKLTLKGGVFSLDGTEEIMGELTVDLKRAKNCQLKKHYTGIIGYQFPQHHLSAAENLGINLAEQLLDKGAGNILKEARIANEASN